MSFFQPTTKGYLVRIHAVPGAAVTRVVGLHGDRLKVRLAAPPAKGEANAELLAFLAHALGIRQDQVHLKSGARDRAKVVEVLSTDQHLDQLIMTLLPAP